MAKWTIIVDKYSIKIFRSTVKNNEFSILKLTSLGHSEK